MILQIASAVKIKVVIVSRFDQIIWSWLWGSLSGLWKIKEKVEIRMQMMINVSKAELFTSLNILTLKQLSLSNFQREVPSGYLLSFS